MPQFIRWRSQAVNQTRPLALETIVLMTSVTRESNAEAGTAKQRAFPILRHSWLICMDWSMLMVLGMPGSEPEYVATMRKEPELTSAE